jgi:hypothetical protein
MHVPDRKFHLARRGQARRGCGHLVRLNRIVPHQHRTAPAGFPQEGGPASPERDARWPARRTAGRTRRPAARSGEVPGRGWPGTPRSPAGPLQPARTPQSAGQARNRPVRGAGRGRIGAGPGRGRLPVTRPGRAGPPPPHPRMFTRPIPGWRTYLPRSGKRPACSTPACIFTLRYSRACSRGCDIPHLAWWALRKGISVIGTGDFRIPPVRPNCENLSFPPRPACSGCAPTSRSACAVLRHAPAQGTCVSCSPPISTIYRGGDQTRKVHHLLYAPTFEAADRITTALGKIGNRASGGRPILGLDSRNLLEITLSGGPGCYLVPAHAWTPWFAVLGSKSGFDLAADCYADLAAEVFAIETGLSSDPPMNWMCSALDRYRLVSNSVRIRRRCSGGRRRR